MLAGRGASLRVRVQQVPASSPTASPTVSPTASPTACHGVVVGTAYRLVVEEVRQLSLCYCVLARAGEPDASESLCLDRQEAPLESWQQNKWS